MSDPVQKNLEPYIDKLHAHHSAKEWAEFNTIKANLIKQIKDDNVQVKVYEYFTEHDKNLPAPYNKPEYAWLKDIGKQLVPKSFKIVSDKETLEFEQLAKKIADRRPDYKNNRQWFSSFTKEDIEKSDVADQYKTQYDELGAGAPQSVTDLSEIHRKRQKDSLANRLVDMIWGDEWMKNAGKADYMSAGNYTSKQFKPDTKKVGDAWKDVKKGASQAGKSFKPRPGTTGGSTPPTTTLGSPMPPSSKPGAPSAPSTPTGGGQPTTPEGTTTLVDGVDPTAPADGGTTGPAQPASGAPISRKPPAKSPLAKGSEAAGPPKTGIEKADNKNEVIIAGFLDDSGQQHTLEALFGGMPGDAGRKGGGGAGYGGYGGGAIAGAAGAGGGDGDGEEGGGLSDLIDRYRRNKKDKDKDKKKKKPRKKPRRKPRKPKGKFGRLARGAKNLGSKVFGKGGMIRSGIGAASGALTGGLGWGGLMGSTMSGVGAAGAGAVAGAALSVVAAGAAGYAVGSYLDKKFGVSDKASDKLTDMGESGKLKKQLEASNKDAKSLTEKYKGKKQSIRLKSGRSRRTQVGWDKTLEQNANFIKQDEAAYKQSQKHGVWSSDADKEKEKDAKRQLDNKKRNRKSLLVKYKKWQKEGGDNFKEEEGDPALLRAKHMRDKTIEMAKKHQKGAKQEEMIKAAEDSYKATEAKLNAGKAKKDKGKPAVDVGDIAMPPTGSGSRRYISGPEGKFRLSAKDGLMASTGLGGLFSKMFSGQRTKRPKKKGWIDRIKDKFKKKPQEVIIKNTEKDPVHVKGAVDAAKKSASRMEALQKLLEKEREHRDGRSGVNWKKSNKKMKELEAAISGEVTGSLSDRMKALGASGFASSQPAGSGGIMVGRGRQTAAQRLESGRASIQGSSGDEKAFAEGVSKGQEKFNKSAGASKTGLWGNLIAATSKVADSQPDAGQGKLVTIGGVIPGSIAGEFDRSKRLTNIDNNITALVNNGIKILGARGGKGAAAPAPAPAPAPLQDVPPGTAKAIAGPNIQNNQIDSNRTINMGKPGAK